MFDRVPRRLAAARIAFPLAVGILIGAVAAATSSRADSGRPAAPVRLVLAASASTPRKLQAALVKLRRTLANSYYTKSAVNSTFLRIADANGHFLSVTDANNRFLKVGGTAADSSKLGGMAPSAFVQGHGSVSTNELALPPGPSSQLLLGDAAIRIIVGLGAAAQPIVTLENDTSSSLNFTVTGASTTSTTIASGGGQASLSPNSSQMHIQMFGDPGSGVGKVWTATLSEIGATFVGQLTTGAL